MTVKLKHLNMRRDFLPLIKTQTSCITFILIVRRKLNKGHAPYNTGDRVILAYLPDNSTARARRGVFSDSHERTGGRREPIACDILPGRQIRTVRWKRAEERSGARKLTGTGASHRHRHSPAYQRPAERPRTERSRPDVYRPACRKPAAQMVSAFLPAVGSASARCLPPPLRRSFCVMR